MSPQQIELVRSSHAKVAPIAQQAAAIFYDKLFIADPELRRLFKGDMVQQGERLMTMIGAAVQLLDRPDALLPALHGLGRRHGGYGVRDSHYATVGGALLATLDAGLGADFTPEVREAWTAMYTVVSREMIAASA